jgi:predicted transposase/invertase (TIGR01784 family)
MTNTIDTTNLLSPTCDYVFKRIFGDEKHKAILINFLNSIIQCNQPITSVHIENIELTPEILRGKWPRLDVLATTQDKEIINVEIQVSNEGNIIPRALFYWSRLFSRQLLSGSDYNSLKRTITITILDFNLFDQDQDKHRYWHQCRLTDKEDHNILTELLEIHFLELKKMQALRPNSTVLETWLEFLRNPYSNELAEKAKNMPQLAEAQNILTYLNNDPEARELCRLRDKALCDEASALAYAKAKGKQEGKEEGKEEGIAIGEAKGKSEGEKTKAIEVAKKMKIARIDGKIIQQFTELSQEEIDKL